MSNSLRLHRLQYARLFCPPHLPEFAQIHIHHIEYAVVRMLVGSAVSDSANP